MKMVLTMIDFYLQRKRHYNIGLIIHVIGGLILSFTRETTLFLVLTLFAFLCWFGYDFLNYSSKQKEDAK